MKGPFTITRSGRIAVTLTDVEADALHGVAEEILGALSAHPTEEMRRLFPPGYADDPLRDDEFQRMTRDDLLVHKIEAVRTLLHTLDRGQRKRGAMRTELVHEEAHAWLLVLNDARLILGTRIDVTEEMDHAPLPASHPEAPARNMYLYLSGLQGFLVELLLDAEFPEGA